MSGAGADNVYHPKLWCYDLLLFLQQGTAVVSQGESNLLTQSQHFMTPSEGKNEEVLSRENLDDEVSIHDILQ